MSGAPEVVEEIAAEVERGVYLLDRVRWLLNYARSLQTDRERLAGRLEVVQDELERAERPSPLGRVSAALERVADALERRSA